jgi:Holliday junction resolvase RusA-like endonuclease
VRSGDLGLEDDAELLVVVTNVMARPKKPSKPFPQGDVDNIAKGPLDAITKATGWWVDDKQITTLFVHKRYALSGEQPRTIIEIYTP